MSENNQNNGPQTANNVKNPKFNWKKIIITITLIILLIVGIMYLTGYWKHETEIWSVKDFKTNLKDGWVVKEWRADELNGTVIFELEKGAEKTTRAVVFGFEATRQFTTDALGLNGTKSVFQPTDWSNHWDLATTFMGSTQPAKEKFNWAGLIISFLPTILFMGLLFWMFKRQTSGMGDMFGNKNQAKKMVSSKRFTDVAGQEEVKEEVSEVVDFLRHPKKYKAAGARVPKGILLGGPPGTGKTLIAKAVAGEAKVPFYFISGSNFVEMIVGLGAKRVREMFKEARKFAPSILFIDELDAIGRKRGGSISGNDEREQTLNQILVEMDGMQENSGLLIIGATNRTDVLDPALLRPGRFDRIVTVGLPDIKEREAILKLHAKGKRIDKSVDFKNIAKRIPRYSGAQIENIINEASLLSVREGTEVITLPQIDEAIDRVTAGPAKKHRVISKEENHLVAVHEAGHAVVGLKVKEADVVQKITIIPRGDAGGYTLMTPKQERYNYRKSQLLAKIMGLLGGIAAEQIIFGKGEISTGASNDIERATAIARAMVTQYGMSKLGPIAYERDMGTQYLGSTEKSKEYSDALAERIDEAIREIISNAEKEALKIIRNNTKLLGLIVDELVEKETIVLEEISYINKNLKRLPKSFSKPKKIEKSKSLKDILEKVEKTKKPSEEKVKESTKAKSNKAKTSTKKDDSKPVAKNKPKK